MSVVRIVDDGGDGASFLEVDGEVLPNGDINAFRNLTGVNVRSDDIMVSAYPKSGSHWVMEVIHFLLAGSLDVDELQKMVTMMDSSPETSYRDLPSPRILNTHLRLEQLPADVLKKKVKLICVLRNPMDVAVSYYNFLRVLTFTDYNGKWNNFCRPYFNGKFCYGSWFDHTRHWEEVKKDNPDHPILTLFYEDFKENPVREAKKLRNFLGVDKSDGFVKQVCEHCDFQSMQKRKGTTKMGKYAFRKGEVGDWKNWFTVAQKEWFDELYQDKIAELPIKFRYTLDD
ncbi:sulfotransferase 1A2-like [Haliotis rubra]|uniref:sulfotransferase 1A2-like n=1 Tax=Haliotis rubra TaxID=36100 RepID=UPI001EE5A084|nr:sulfotransferase 1A2-like [Haliotis rubra]